MRFLERQVEEEREANRENRRLQAAALERIPPQIEAPREEREVPESASEEPTSTSPPPEQQEATSRLQERSWWRRMFGT